jgi:hypothetical protein
MLFIMNHHRAIRPHNDTSISRDNFYTLEKIFGAIFLQKPKFQELFPKKLKDLPWKFNLRVARMHLRSKRPNPFNYGIQLESNWKERNLPFGFQLV